MALHKHIKMDQEVAVCAFFCLPRTLVIKGSGHLRPHHGSDGNALARLLDCNNAAGICSRVRQALSKLNELCLEVSLHTLFVSV